MTGGDETTASPVTTYLTCGCSRRCPYLFIPCPLACVVILARLSVRQHVCARQHRDPVDIGKLIEVTLTLREPIDPSVITDALRRTLVRAPCEVTFQADGTRLLHLEAGWAATLPDLVDVVRARLRAASREDGEGADRRPG